MNEFGQADPVQDQPVENTHQRLWDEAHSQDDETNGLDDFDDLDSLDTKSGGYDFSDEYVTGLEPTIESGDSEERVAAYEQWLAGLLADQRDELTVTRAGILNDRLENMVRGDQIEARLKIQAPELLRGTLPSDMADRMPGPFALGINQSIDGDVEEASDYLARERGLPLLNYGPIQRFEFVDQSTDPFTIEQKIEGGYYGNSEIGRFIVAFPLVDATPEEAVMPAEFVSNETRLPLDFYVPTDGPHGPSNSVNGKYVAGFIDGEGNFHRNRKFGEGLDLTPESDWS